MGEDTCPETLLFDLERLARFRQDAQEAITLAAILVTFGQAASSFKSDAGDQAYLQNVVTGIVTQSAIDTSPKGVEIIADGIQAALLLSNMPGETKERLRNNIIAAAKPGGPVYKLMSKRVRSAYLSVVKSGTIEESVGTRTIKDVLPRIKASAMKLRQLAIINRTTHITHYNRIIRKETKSCLPALLQAQLSLV